MLISIISLDSPQLRTGACLNTEQYGEIVPLNLSHCQTAKLLFDMTDSLASGTWSSLLGVGHACTVLVIVSCGLCFFQER